MVIRFKHFPEIRSDVFMMTIEPLDIYRKMRIMEDELPSGLVIHALQRIGLNILPDIAGELVDIGTAVDGERTVSFDHPATRNIAGLKRAEANQ
jgi:hypothetical protein